MMSMVFEIWIGIILGALVGALWYYLAKCLKRSLDIKDKVIETDKYRLFAQMNTDAIREEINKMIESYVSKYALYNFIYPNVNFISNEAVNTCVKEVTKSVILEMSELYVFYFKILYNIQDEDDLLKHIKELVEDYVITYAADYNINKSETKKGE